MEFVRTGKSRIAFALQNLIPNIQQGLCSTTIRSSNPNLIIRPLSALVTMEVKRMHGTRRQDSERKKRHRGLRTIQVLRDHIATKVRSRTISCGINIQV